MYSLTIEPRLRDGELSAYIWMMLALWAAIFFGDDTFKCGLWSRHPLQALHLHWLAFMLTAFCWVKVWPHIGVFRACFLVIRGWPTSQNRTKWPRIWDKCQPQHRLSPSKDFVHENNNLRHKSNHKSNRFGPQKIEQTGAGEGLAERKGDVTKV